MEWRESPLTVSQGERGLPDATVPEQDNLGLQGVRFSLRICFGIPQLRSASRLLQRPRLLAPHVASPAATLFLIVIVRRSRLIRDRANASAEKIDVGSCHRKLISYPRIDIRPSKRIRRKDSKLGFIILYLFLNFAISKIYRNPRQRFTNCSTVNQQCDRVGRSDE